MESRQSESESLWTTPPPRTRLDLGVALALGALAFVLYAATMPRLATTEGDAAEFLVTALVGGVPHPPGYPTYALVTRALAWLAPSAATTTLTLFSCACGAAAASLWYLLARRVARIPGAIAAAGLWATAAEVWTQNTVIEVYAPTNLLIAAVLHLGLWAIDRRRDAPLIVAALLTGLGVGVHHTVPFAAVIIAVVALGRARSWALQPRLVLATVAACAAGVCAYGYLPFASHADPPIDLGNPETLDAVWNVFRMKGLDSMQPRPRTVANFLYAAKRCWYFFTQQHPIPAIPIGLVGVVAAVFSRQARLTWLPFALVAVAFGPAFYLWLNPPHESYAWEWRVFMLPSYGACCVGAGAALDLASRAFTPKLSRSRAGSQALAAAAIAIPLLAAAARFARQDQTDNRVLYDYGRNLLAQLPRGSLLLTDGSDAPLFASWYQQYVFQNRSDVAVYHMPLDGSSPYRIMVGQQYPALRDVRSEGIAEVARAYLRHGSVYATSSEVGAQVGLTATRSGLTFRLTVGTASGMIAPPVPFDLHSAGWVTGPPGRRPGDGWIMVEYMRAWVDARGLSSLETLISERPWLAFYWSKRDQPLQGAPP